MGKNLTIKAGDCNHRRYIPKLVELVASGAFDPSEVLTQIEPMSDVIEAYKAFDRRADGWIKVELTPSAGRTTERTTEGSAIASASAARREPALKSDARRRVSPS